MSQLSSEMALFTVEEVLEITSARVLAGQMLRGPCGRIRRVCTDSRQTRPGDLFLALKGERFDGHQFVSASLRRGAVAAVVREDYRYSASSSPRSRRLPLLLGVPDTLLAYQHLAAQHRGRFQIPLVAVTGSNGKTTTKDMVAHVLAERWRVLKTEGNLNNQIGVPQTLLGLQVRHEAAVVEMGVDQKGQTTRLCKIARPTMGLITNIGPDHLEFFGTIDGSAQAKGELLDMLPSDGAAVLNADDPYFGHLASRARCRVLTFGLSGSANVRAADVALDPRRGLSFGLMLPERSRPQRVSLSAHGTHNLVNALAAAAVGHLVGITGRSIAHGLARFRPATMRSQIIRWRGVSIINDCYNANPVSMKAAINLLADLGVGQRTIAVLGDMLELGPASLQMHREVGAYVAQCGITLLIACGDLGKELAQGARKAGMPSDRIHDLADPIDAAGKLRSLAGAGDVVLLKASRGMQMERVIEVFTGARSR